MFWWFSRTNETYAFLPRVSWVGTSRISGRRFWGSWETLHAALETRARQYWCAFITVIYTLPVSKAGQVGDVGYLLVTAASGCWAWKMTLKYLNLKTSSPGFQLSHQHTPALWSTCDMLSCQFSLLWWWQLYYQYDWEPFLDFSTFVRCFLSTHLSIQSHLCKMWYLEGWNTQKWQCMCCGTRCKLQRPSLSRYGMPLPATQSKSPQGKNLYSYPF